MVGGWCATTRVLCAKILYSFKFRSSKNIQILKKATLGGAKSFNKQPLKTWLDRLFRGGPPPKLTPTQLTHWVNWVRVDICDHGFMRVIWYFGVRGDRGYLFAYWGKGKNSDGRE